MKSTRIKDDVKRLIVKRLMSCRGGILAPYQLQLAVEQTLGYSWSDHTADITDAINELDSARVIRAEKFEGQFLLHEGIEFDEYVKSPNDSPATIEIHSFTNNGTAQIGNNNVAHTELVNGLECLIKDINSSDCSESEKQTALKQLKLAFSNPAVSAAIGGAVSGIIGLFGK